MTIALAVFGALLVAVGAGLIYLPAGFIAAGLILVATAYTSAYFKARSVDETP